MSRARAAIARGSARIRREYLDRVTAAFAGDPAALTELPAPVEPLDRES